MGVRRWGSEVSNGLGESDETGFDELRKRAARLGFHGHHRFQMGLYRTACILHERGCEVCGWVGVAADDGGGVGEANDAEVHVRVRVATFAPNWEELRIWCTVLIVLRVVCAVRGRGPRRTVL